MADILRQIYYGRYITAEILGQIYYGRYIMAYIYRDITADILWQIYYGNYITAGILQQVYYGRYITADILRQIHYGRYVAYHHKDGHISTNFQRQKLSIAASESACCNASPQGLLWTVLCCIRREQNHFWSVTGPNRGRRKVSGGGGRPWEEGVCP
jgi:hypothetical protein